MYEFKPPKSNSLQFGEKAGSQLYDEFKKFDQGKIGVDGFVKAVENVMIVFTYVFE